MKMSEPLILSLSDIQQQMGSLTAKFRKESHDKTRQVKADLGSYGFYADKYGCSAEIILGQALNAIGILTPGITLFSDPPPRGGGDFRIGNFKYEIKSSPPGRTRVCYNIGAYEKRAYKTDFVVCVFYLTETKVAITKPITHTEIALTWQKDLTARDPFYFQNRDQFDFISDWSELPGVSSVLKPGTHSN